MRRRKKLFSEPESPPCAQTRVRARYKGKSGVFSGGAVAREFARAFYRSQSWKRTREAYFRRRRGLCERCFAHGIITPGEIVHHKQHLTPDNIDDPAISLGFDNLELLCRPCHAGEHPEIYPERKAQRVAFDENGNTVAKEVGWDSTRR